MLKFYSFLIFILPLFFQSSVLGLDDNSKNNEPLIFSDMTSNKIVASEIPLIKKIILEGNRVFLDEELQPITEKFLKQPATLFTVQQIAQEISEFYWQKGFLTSDAYPSLEQDISQGLIIIKIREGELEDIKINNLSGRQIDDEFIRSWLRFRAGTPLNIDKLSEALKILQLKPNIQTIEADLKEGTLPKFSRLEMNIRQAPNYQIQVQGDNFGSFNSGQEEGFFEFSVKSLSGRGDQLQVKGIISEGSEQAIIDYRFPLCLIDCVSLGIHYEIGNSEVIREPLEVFDIEGEYQKFFAEISQPIIKELTTELDFDLKFGWQRSETFVLGRRFSFSPQTTDGQYDIYTARIGVNWQERWETGSFINRGELTLGADSLEETSDPFILVRLQSNWVQKINETLLISVFGSLQLTPSSLGRSFGILPSEQFSIGGISTVPGYDLNLRRGDNGINLKVDLSQTIFENLEGEKLTVNPYIAFGYVWNKREEVILLEPTTLSSIGANLQYTLKGLRLNLGIAVPLTEVPSNFEQTTYFSVGYRFF